MKKLSSYFTTSALALFLLGALLASCEGPEGQPGANGKDGSDGTDGVDANSFCISCHNTANKDLKKTQLATSVHWTGFTVGYAGGRNGCASCHSDQGYKETVLTGRDTTATGFAIPMPLQCDACHDFHNSLDETEFPDYALRNNNPVGLLLYDKATVVNIPGSGNVCGFCHQPRGRAEFPLVVDGADSINITSKYWGPHHGPQSAVLSGVGAFEIGGSMTYINSGHTGTIGCTKCHMNKDGGDDVGGHSFSMVSPTGVENIAACTSCHGSATSFDIHDVQTEITGLLEHLRELLIEKKLIDEEGHVIPSSKAEGIGRKFTSNEAGAVFNYLLLEEDKSEGAHNYKYTKAALTNTIELVESW